MTATEHVILVDTSDNPLGIAEKLTAHTQNLCHRAFSIFICRRTSQNGAIEVLLQQRASHKYHTPGLWTNTCCSHPRPGEATVIAAQRRLEEEIGIRTSLKSLGSFHYVAHLENGLVENEVDHVLVGFVDKTISVRPNPNEIQNTRWVEISALENELEKNPKQFTPWLKQALELVANACVPNPT